MKKILTLFLALITILSVTLVACNDSTPPSTSDDGGEDEFVSRNPTTSDTSDDTDDKKNNTGAWTEVNYTIYAMADSLNIREEASSTSKSWEKVNIGTSLTAVAKNDDWYKISYANGTDGVAFVSADFVTTDASEATFKNLDTPEVLKIKEDTSNTYGENGREVNLRQYPIFNDNSTYITVYRKNTENGELVKVAANTKGDIWKVQYTAAGATTPVTYYIGGNAFQHFEGYSASTGGVG